MVTLAVLANANMLQHARTPRRSIAQQCIIEMRGKKKQSSHHDTYLDICSMCAVLYFTLVGNASRVHLFILSRGMATAAYSNAKPEGNAGWISKHMRPKLGSATPQRCMFTLLQLGQEVNLCNSHTYRCSHISMHIPAWALWPILFHFHRKEKGAVQEDRQRQPGHRQHAPARTPGPPFQL